MLLRFFAQALLAITPTATPADTPTILRPFESQPIERRLQGDWEIPDVVTLTYNGAWLDALEASIQVLREHTQVLLLVSPEDLRDPETEIWLTAQGLPAEDVDIEVVDFDTSWVRDYGPIQTTGADGTTIWLDADYSSRPADDLVPQRLSERFSVRLEAIPEGLDGGALVSNGDGLCLSTHEAFALSGIDPEEPEATNALLRQLGCRALALTPALLKERTKHADLFVQFFGPDVVAVASYDPEQSMEDAARTDAAAKVLVEAASMLGQRLRVVRIPHPAPQGDLYQSYINGLQVGSVFLIPRYREVPTAAEAAAKMALGSIRSNLRLAPIPADEMIALNGAVHCITLGLKLKPNRQVPKRRRGLHSVRARRSPQASHPRPL